MRTYNKVQEIYHSHHGSEQLYKRSYCDYLFYTEGVMDFQKSLDAIWLVDNIISYMLKVIKSYKEHGYDFFVVEVCLNKDNKGYMEVFTEDYINGEYHEHIGIMSQTIPFIDLPTNPDEDITTYKFYLELVSIEPIAFCLLLPSEH